jgi:hypothetical protein
MGYPMTPERTVSRSQGARIEGQDGEQCEGVRKKGMSKSRAAAIGSAPGASRTGGKTYSGGCRSQSSNASGSGSEGNRASESSGRP